MNSKNEYYLKQILSQIEELVDAKYRVGYKQHSKKEGDIWDNPLLLDHAIDEAVDLLIYLLTLKKQNE